MIVLWCKLIYRLSTSKIYALYQSDIAIFVRILKMCLSKFKLVILLAIPADAYRRIAGLGENYIVIKVRVRNSNIQKGKSAGYRLVYQVESPTNVLVLTIYSKSDRDDISSAEILNILASISGDDE